MFHCLSDHWARRPGSPIEDPHFSVVAFEKTTEGVLQEADLIATPTRESAIARARQASSEHGGALALVECEGGGRRVIASFGAVWD